MDITLPLWAYFSSVHKEFTCIILSGIPVDPAGLPWWLSACNAGDPGSIPWRREWLPTPVFLPGEFYGQKSLAGYIPWGRKESDLTDQLNASRSTQQLSTRRGHSDLGWWSLHLGVCRPKASPRDNRMVTGQRPGCLDSPSQEAGHTACG